MRIPAFRAVGRTAFLSLIVALSSFGHAWAQTCSGVTLTNTDNPDPIAQGGSIAYTINLSRSTALLNVTLTDSLPSNVRFQSLVSPAGVTCTTPAVGATGPVTCTFNYDPERIFGLTATNQIVTFAAHTPSVALSSPLPVTGLQAGESLVAIDVRPSTQQLYGIGSTSRLYVINTTTGAATQVGTAGAFTLSGTFFGMDFNPSVDRIRVISDTEQNIRINPFTGALAAVDTALSPAGNVVGLAYTNNIAGATPTTTYAIDFATDTLKLLGGINGTPSPNGGVLTTVGALGVVTSSQNIGFDVSPSGTAYALLPVGGISREYTINLATGAATLVGNFPANNFIDIAVAPSVNLDYQFTLTTTTSPAIAIGTVSNTVSVSSSSEICTTTATAVTTVSPPPTLTLTPPTVNFGAVNSAGTITSVTPAQNIAIVQNGPGTVTWTAASNVPWLSVSPASGSGTGTITASITTNAALLPPTGTAAATITVTGVGSSNSPTATVNLSVLTPGQAAAPFGNFDTPTNGQANVTGAIPVTGWAVDDVGVTRVQIYRNPVGAENPAQLVFIGDAVLVNGARPDVAATYPDKPLKDQAGWGYMLLTNQLPNQGNGTFTLTAQVTDVEGHTTSLGSRTITCTNATATAPFGTIDTPGQGATISGSAYINFGWALTPLPKTIPIDGSTIQVLIDSVPVGTVTYNLARPDIQQAFPGLNNTNGAVGYRALDTTTLSNGVHTIAWIATDDQGAATGIGSRYFTVSNGSSSLVLGDPRASVVIAASVAAKDTPPALDIADPREIRRYRVAQLERLELSLRVDDQEDASYRGYEISGDRLVALPAGSTLDADTGSFVWAPGLGYGGTHQLVFVRRDGSGEHQIRVDVAIDAQRARDEAARVVIDTPSSDVETTQSFVIAGWAIDPAGPSTGPGIDVLHVWAHPIDGSAPLFAGVAAYGGERPDVARHFGRRYLRSGFGARVGALPPGTYDIVVYGFSLATGRFSVAASVRVTVK